MKRHLLISLAVLLTCGLVAQHAVPLPKEMINKSMKAEYQKPLKGFEDPGVGVNYTVGPRAALSPSETQLGISWYDLQSNYLLQNRVIYDPSDGTIGVVWTRGIEATAFPDRGTGYNFFDGSSWNPEPTARIEDDRTGWPNYGRLGEDGEIVIAHLPSGLKISRRSQRNTGDWTYSTLMGPAEAPDLTWPRMITTGEDHNTVHMIVNTYDPYQGQPQALLYYRSTDGGDNWDIADELIDGLGADYYTEINADTYDWAEPRGDTIAFIVAYAWNDMFAMRSYDNGDTWEKVMIWEHPYPFFDWETTIADTFFCVDNSATIALDKTGKIHVTFGINRVMHQELGTTYSYFPWVDGIGYWNEDMPPFSNDLSALAPPQYGYPTSEMVEDYNYIGYTQDVDGDGEITFITTSTGFPMTYRTIGLSNMPTISVDDDGNVFIVFTSYTETYDNFEWNYRKVWARGMLSDGNWGDFVHLTADIIHIFDESYFPQLAPASDDNLFLVYNNDASPGLAFSGDHDWQENRLTFSTFPKTDLLPTIGVEENVIPESISIQSIYPNPASGITFLRVELQDPSNLTVRVTDLTGKKVWEEGYGRLNTGLHRMNLDVSSLQSGIYFVEVQGSGISKTEKIIVRH